MELQEMFDRVAIHMLTQNAKSMLGSYCAYRGANGLRCALGHLIPDSKYSTSFETLGLEAIERQGRGSALLDALGIVAKSKQFDLAVTLQNVHDCYSPIEWRKRLQEVALDFGLSAEAVSEFEARRLAAVAENTVSSKQTEEAVVSLPTQEEIRL